MDDRPVEGPNWGVGLGEGATEPPRSNPGDFIAPSNRATLDEAIADFRKSARVTARHAADVASLADATLPWRSKNQCLKQLSSLRAAEQYYLDKTTDQLRGATARYIVSYVASRAPDEETIQDLLEHFRGEMISIAKFVLRGPRDHSVVLHDVLEAFYNESLDRFGTMHADSFFFQLDKARYQVAYNPHSYCCQTEGPSVCQDSLSDDALVEAFHARCRGSADRDFDAREMRSQEWIGFWLHALRTWPVKSTALEERQPPSQLGGW